MKLTVVYLPFLLVVITTFTMEPEIEVPAISVSASKHTFLVAAKDKFAIGVPLELLARFTYFKNILSADTNEKIHGIRLEDFDQKSLCNFLKLLDAYAKLCSTSELTEAQTKELTEMLLHVIATFKDFDEHAIRLMRFARSRFFPEPICQSIEYKLLQQIIHQGAIHALFASESPFDLTLDEYLRMFMHYNLGFSADVYDATEDILDLIEYFDQKVTQESNAITQALYIKLLAHFAQQIASQIMLIVTRHPALHEKLKEPAFKTFGPILKEALLNSKNVIDILRSADAGKKRLSTINFAKNKKEWVRSCEKLDDNNVLVLFEDFKTLGVYDLKRALSRFITFKDYPGWSEIEFISYPYVGLVDQDEDIFVIVDIISGRILREWRGSCPMMLLIKGTVLYFLELEDADVLTLQLYDLKTNVLKKIEIGKPHDYACTYHDSKLEIKWHSNQENVFVYETPRNVEATYLNWRVRPKNNDLNEKFTREDCPAVIQNLLKRNTLRTRVINQYLFIAATIDEKESHIIFYDLKNKQIYFSWKYPAHLYTPHCWCDESHVLIPDQDTIIYFPELAPVSELLVFLKSLLPNVLDYAATKRQKLF